MKKIIPFLFLFFLNSSLSAQNFTGQWKGEFTDNSTAFVGWGGDRCEYVLEIECRGAKVTGYSYTYFSIEGKRFYTICKLTGTLNKASNYIEVKETERTKTNVPQDVRNCFQIHRLTYSKQDDEQVLEGSWVPVPGQQGDCGFGTTVLSRRVLKKNPEYFNNTVTNKPPVKSPVAKTIPKKTTPPAIVKTKPKETFTKPNKKTEPVVATKPNLIKPVPEKKTVPETASPETQKTEPAVIKPEPAEKKIIDSKYEKRNSNLIKTIEIDNETFSVDLYDNGEIDGDSISLFFNSKLILSHKRLTSKALSLKLDIDDKQDLNELIMYAENLGTIPPNTALMVVHDGDNRYEVRISSDLQKSGVIRFVHKTKNKQ